GPVGLTTALGLAHYGIPFVLFEDEDRLSTETKAGTTLSRSLEIWRRFGVASSVLRRSMRVDEIGDIDRQTNQPRRAVQLSVLGRETRFPFVINLPQQDMEPVLAEPVHGQLRLSHRLTRFEQKADRVILHFNTPNGEKTAMPSICSAATVGAARCGSNSASRSKAGRCRSSIRWSISRSISISQIPATTLISRTFPTRGSG